MNKKTIIACIAALAVLAAAVAAAVFFLYSGTDDTKAAAIASDSRTGLLAAVPSDAVMVVEFSDLKTACSLLADSAGCFSYLAGNGRVLEFLGDVEAAGFGGLRSSKTVLSMHYNGALAPLLVLDAGRSGSVQDSDLAAFRSEADSAGLSVLHIDGSSLADPKSYLFRRDILLVSTSDVLPKSSERHLGKGISILDSDGFAKCVETSQGADNTVFVSVPQSGKFLTGVADRSVYGYSDFLKRFSGWVSLSVRDNDAGHLSMDGSVCYNDGVEDFVNVFRKYRPSKSSAASMLPSYTIFFAALPVDDVSAYISASDMFADGTGQIGKIEAGRRQLQKTSGIAPVQWAVTLGIKEIAAAFFRVGEKVEKVILMKMGNSGMSTVFKDVDPSSGKASAPKVCRYSYQGFAASVFGPFFSLEDESCFTYMHDWIIVGSQSAVSEYVEGRALEYPLASYLSDASVQPVFSGKEDGYFVSYLSLSEDPEAVSQVFKPSYASSLTRLADGYNHASAAFCISADKDGKMNSSAEVFRVSVTKSKAPVFERDTVVVVPKGPFKVKNSGTGRMNLFCQQDNMYLCLKEISGKGIWGVPFSAPICGNAGTIDYFANGKLQILFASGSRLYLIDRLGRYVNPFPVDLGKDILIGPGIYDFNGNRKYNVMILHKDNTIEMYNLQGKKPAQWKTITSAETIKGLPEAVKVAGKTYWVVRTSIQTLIFGFYGGEPLTDFEGDRMIRSDSRITPGEGASVKAVCYDGKKHVIKLT